MKRDDLIASIIFAVVAGLIILLTGCAGSRRNYNFAPHQWDYCGGQTGRMLADNPVDRAAR